MARSISSSTTPALAARALRPMDGSRLGLDARRQSDGGRLGDRDLRAAYRKYGEGGQIVSTASSPGDLADQPALQRQQIRRRRALGRPARRTRAARHRRFRTLSRLHQDTDLRVPPQPARAVRAAAAARRRPAAPGAGVHRLRCQRIEGGIDPLYVGELVREGIENDWPYIFTDAEFEPFIEARFARSNKASTASGATAAALTSARRPRAPSRPIAPNTRCQRATRRR